MLNRRDFLRFGSAAAAFGALPGCATAAVSGPKPIDPNLMKLQLDAGLELFRQGEVEGFIFHCTPLCDLGLEAVDVAREWIRDYGDEIAPNV